MKQGGRGCAGWIRLERQALFGLRDCALLVVLLPKKSCMLTLSLLAVACCSGVCVCWKCSHLVVWPAALSQLPGGGVFRRLSQEVERAAAERHGGIKVYQLQVCARLSAGCRGLASGCNMHLRELTMIVPPQRKLLIQRCLLV